MTDEPMPPRRAPDEDDWEPEESGESVSPKLDEPVVMPRGPYVDECPF